MARYARWFAVLGVFAVLPAAILLGSGAGEALRWPNQWAEHLLQHETAVMGLGVIATFLLRTAAGLRKERTWALHVGMGMAALLIVAGLATLVLGGRLAAALYGTPQLMLGTIPLSLAALLLGSRLLAGLWAASDYALPFDGADLRALGALAGVLALAAASHVLVSSIPT